MASIVKILRVVADPNRLRILLLLEREELSVAESVARTNEKLARRSVIAD